MTPDQGFGLVLKELRQERRLSQERLAEASGCSRQYISLLETGRSSPSLSMLFQLASALQLTPVDLLLRLQAKL